MTTGGTISWSKVWTFIGVLGIPLAGLSCWLIIFGTKLTVSIDEIRSKQDTQAIRLNSIDTKISELSIRVDTIGQRQRDYQLERYYKEKFANK